MTARLSDDDTLPPDVARAFSGLARRAGRMVVSDVAAESVAAPIAGGEPRRLGSPPPLDLRRRRRHGWTCRRRPRRVHRGSRAARRARHRRPDRLEPGDGPRQPGGDGQRDPLGARPHRHHRCRPPLPQRAGDRGPRRRHTHLSHPRAGGGIPDVRPQRARRSRSRRGFVPPTWPSPRANWRASLAISATTTRGGDSPSATSPVRREIASPSAPTASTVPSPQRTGRWLPSRRRARRRQRRWLVLPSVPDLATTPPHSSPGSTWRSGDRHCAPVRR